jgi:tetratricopeptide (TPR) repeat protein
MGGDATFSGTTYQARVIAFAYLHILAQTRLGWFSPDDDTPAAISGETGGPGDDAMVEFGTIVPSCELQAKHGLSGGDALKEIFVRIAANSPDDIRRPVVLALNRLSSTRWLCTILPADLARIRSGRPSEIRVETKRLLEDLKELGVSIEKLQSLYVAPIDIDNAQEPEAKEAIYLLEKAILADAGQASAAWALLVGDAADLCARKERRTRKSLVSLLQGAGIQVRPAAKDDVWHRRLEFTKQTLNKQHPATALVHLNEIERDLAASKDSKGVEPFVRYRLFQQRAAAFLALERPQDALDNARKALDIDSHGLHALISASAAARQLGDLSTAARFSETAVTHHANDPLAWGILVHSNSARGESPPNPPPGIAESAQYRMALAEVAMWNDNIPELLRLTKELLAEGERTPAILFHRANALIDASGGIASVPDGERYPEVERLTTEVIESIADDAHPITIKAYLVRSSARRLMRNIQGADEDLKTARRVDPDDPDALYQTARVLLEGDNHDGALDVLHHPAVATDQRALVMRARLEALKGDEFSARRDLDSALVGLKGSRRQDRLRFAAADVALILSDVSLVRRILDGLSEDARQSTPVKSLYGRLAFREGDPDRGAAIYRQAASADPEDRPLLLAELGSQLLAANRPTEAVAAFSELTRAEIPAEAYRIYTRTLFVANELESAQNFIDFLATLGPLPSWALAAATDIALKQDDTEAAIAHLGMIVQRNNSNVGARMELTRLLIEAGETESANAHIEQILQIEGLPPLERMQLAQLLHAAGRSEEALPIAHGAFKEENADPRFHRAFIIMTLFSKGDPPTTSSVSVETHVKLQDASGGVLEYTIRDSANVDPRVNELSATAAQKIGLLGLKVGEKWVRHEKTWQEQTWTVEEIIPTLLRDAQDAAVHYESRFPAEPFFMTAINIGTGGSIKDFAPMIASLDARKKHVETVFNMYREQGLPLGMIATLCGSSIPEVIEQLTRGTEHSGPFVVESSDRRSYETARSVALKAERLVLTRSALHTIADLDLLNLLAKEYVLLGPLSLKEELRDELREAERFVAEGHKIMAQGDTGLILREWPPSDPALIARRDSVGRILEFVNERIQLQARPFDTIKPSDSSADSLREIIGAASADAVYLAQHYGAPLLADDLGLRRLELGPDPWASVSTVTLLEGLEERKALTAVERDKYLIQLSQRWYSQIMPTRTLLTSALKNASELGEIGLKQVFSTLGAPGIDIGDAARITAQVVRAHRVVADVQLVSVAQIIRLAVDGMAKTWPIHHCAQAVARAASQEFALFPKMSLEVRDACQVAAKEYLLNATKLSSN